MEILRFLHCSDIHFDSSFKELPALKAEERREELRETFGKIVDIVKDNGIPIFLISGDLFDSEFIRQETINYVLKKFREIKDTYIFISPGNHDPFNEKSYYNTVAWPDNVRIFKNNFDMFKLDEYRTCIYGIGFGRQCERVSLVRNIDISERFVDKDFINIMVIHADVVSSVNQSSDYNPVTEDLICKSGMDYIALGHRHEYSGLKRVGNTYWCYSGNPEGRGFDETGSKGVVLGKMAKGFCEVQFLEICKRKYIIKSIELNNCMTHDDILEEIYNQIIKIDNECEKNLYKIILKGTINEDLTVRTNILAERLKDKFYFVKLEDMTSYNVEYVKGYQEYSLKGLFIKKIMEEIENSKDEEEKLVLMKALKVGLQSLERGEVVI